MSSIRKIRCKGCQSVFKVRLDGQEKKRIRCPECDEQIVVGGTAPKPTPKQRPAKSRPSSYDDDYGYDDDDYGSPSRPAPVRSRSSSKKKKKKGKKSSGNGILYGVIGGVVALLLIVSVILGITLMGGGDNTPSQAKATVAQNGNNPNANKVTPGKAKPQDTANSTLDSSWIKSSTAPVDMFSASTITSKNPPSILYKWQSGTEFSYYVSFDSVIQEKKISHTGISTLTVRGERNLSSFRGSEVVERGGKGNGTGFVVSPDGYIVTCKHVIDGASKIEARVAGKMYPAKVLAIHKSEDLAILQIQGKNFPYVPIADSDKVRLGSQVRVIGYPVAAVLGSSVKFTQGNIAGIAEKMKRFQLDCVVNPGNSGGPAFNNKGEVIGVTDSKLVKEEFSQICFAIPTQPVEEFLKEQNVPYQKTARTKVIESEVLVSNVEPAVAYIEVTSGSKKKGKSYEVDYSTVLTSLNSKIIRTRSGIRIPVPETNTENGKILVSRLGQIHYYHGRESFPFRFDHFGLLMIDEFPNEETHHWGSKNVKIINGLPCMVSSHYYVASSFGSKVEIRKQYQVRSVDDAENPTYKISGKGILIFDKSKGVAEKYDFKGEVSLLLNGGTSRLKIPLTVKYILRTPEEIAASKKKVEEQKKQAKEIAKKRAEPPSAQERQQVLTALKSKNHDLMRKALQFLSRKKPVSFDKEISKRVVALTIYKKDSLVRAYARTAVINWTSPESVREISKILSSSAGRDGAFRSVLTQGLATTKTIAAARKLVSLLKGDSMDRHYAKTALKQMGPIAESETIKLLKTTNNDIKVALCEVLSVIGTKKSLLPLNKLRKREGTNYYAIRAKMAMDAIKRRG